MRSSWRSLVDARGHSEPAGQIACPRDGDCQDQGSVAESGGNRAMTWPLLSNELSEVGQLSTVSVRGSTQPANVSSVRAELLPPATCSMSARRCCSPCAPFNGRTGTIHGMLYDTPRGCTRYVVSTPEARVANQGAFSNLSCSCLRSSRASITTIASRRSDFGYVRQLWFLSHCLG